MTKLTFPFMKGALAAIAMAAAMATGPAMAAETGALPHAGTDLGDQASLQRGAKLYMNYCSGCHSLQYLRYSRMAADLGLTEEQVQASLNFTGAKPGEQVQVAMTPEQGTAFFGKAPPDLSVIARVRGTDWISAYLKSFYLDESRPIGWNNTVFPNASRPNVLWQMQGLQHAEFGPEATGERPVETIIGRILTFLYYAFFITMPLWTKFDRTRPVPERVSSHD